MDFIVFKYVGYLFGSRWSGWAVQTKDYSSW